MATNIKLKRSASAGAVPGTSDVALGELALNTTDGKLYMKKSVSGSESIVEISGTKAPTSSAFSHQEFKYTASSNQTTFSGNDANSVSLSYTANQIQVFLNGILLDATDFTATNGTSVVLASGASSGDILQIQAFAGTNPIDTFKYVAGSDGVTSFSGDDANSNSLVYTVGNINVYLNGVLLDASDFTATTGTSVVLASGASSGDILVIVEYNVAGLTDLADDTTPQLTGDLDVNGQDIVSTSNAHIDIIPHGTGNVNLGTDTVQIGDSGENVTITTNSTGDLTLNTNSGTNSGSIVIADGANSDITLTPNGTGDVILDGLKYPQSDGSNGQVLTTNGSGQLSFSDKTSAALDDISTGDAAVTLATSTGDITIDSPADIILDADGRQVFFKDGGTTVGTVTMTDSNFKFISDVSDKDMIFAGTDGGSEITALTLDMSSSGQATFNSSVFVGNHLYLGDNKKAIFGAGEDLFIRSDGTAGEISATDNLTIDVAGDITLDADGGDIVFKDAGTSIAKFSNNASDLQISVETADKDIKFNGTDGSSGITALKLDMSNSGRAVFNAGAGFSDHVNFSDNAQAVFGGGDDLKIYHDGSNNYILANTTDQDLIIQGNDGGSTITALTLDMSEGGAATFAAKVTVNQNAVGALTTDNDGSFDMSASINFKCTPSGNFTLTFTNIVSQSGNILLVNSGGHTVSAHSNTKVDANLLATVSTAGTYLLSYFSDGTDVFLTNSAVYT